MKRFILYLNPKMTRRSRTSIADVARRAGCALGSASKVLNGVEGVSPEMRERVQKAAEDLGYIPNRSARMLKSGRTWRLGLLLPFASDLFYSRQLDAYHDVALQRGYRLEIHFHQWSPIGEDQAIRDLIESGVEGVIVHSSHSPSEAPPYLDLLRKHQIHFAIKGLTYSSYVPKSYEFFLDLKQASMLLTEYLIRLGHRQLTALIPSPLIHPMPEMKSRLEGIAEVVASYPGVSFNPLSIENADAMSELRSGIDPERAGVSFFQKYMEALVARFTREQDRGTAVITFNQMTAWRVIEALRDEGLRVPEDISVAAVGLSHIDHFAAFPLTTAEFSPIETAEIAVAMALGERAFPPPIPATLVPRRSTAPLPQLV